MRTRFVFTLLAAGFFLGLPGGRGMAQGSAADPNKGGLAQPLLRAPIEDPVGKPLGEALIYFNFVELLDTKGEFRGAVGAVNQAGRIRLFLVRSDESRAFIGWSENQRLYDPDNKLVGYYFWTPVWSYVYTPDRKKVGQAQCLAYQGVCAAGVAGFLLGLMEAPPVEPPP